MRMYVIVNKDMGKKIRKRGMTKGYQHVQVNHAMAEFLIKHPEVIKSRVWLNETLIVLKASRRQFTSCLHKIFYKNLKPFAVFKEPDLNNELTSVAVLLKEKDYGIFKRLELL